MSLVVPAVLPSSREDLNGKLALFASIPSVSRVQIDVVDGRVAAPASWPYSAKATQGTPYSAPSELDAMVHTGEMLPNLDRVEYEVDLMCFDASAAAAAWLALGATRLTFHTESALDMPRLLADVREQYGNFISLGCALNVTSDLALVRSCLNEVAYVQFMGIVRIGRQGQPFDERVLENIATFHTRYPDVPFQVDGGVSLANAKKLIALGAENLVVGSSILKASDPAAAFAQFEALKSPYGV